MDPASRVWFHALENIAMTVIVCAGLGGIATRPWRAIEHLLTGRKASDEPFSAAADIPLTRAVARAHNHFKIELAKRTIVRAFVTARGANTGAHRQIVISPWPATRAAGHPKSSSVRKEIL